MEDPGLLPAREHTALHVGGLVARPLLERLETVLGHRVGKSRTRNTWLLSGWQRCVGRLSRWFLSSISSSTAARFALPTVFRGHAELDEGFDTWVESWEELVIEPLEVFEDGDYVLVV
jgi:hypothetical protein